MPSVALISPGGGAGGAGQLSDDHLALGSVLLTLISDWNEWVDRRVDSFRFSGDDERVLERRQSMDFVVPAILRTLPESVTSSLGGWPVPVTFVNKWRLQQFSLRDEGNRAIALLPRSESVPIATGMLVTLGSMLVDRRAISPTHGPMPRAIRDALFHIAASDPSDAIRACAEFGERLASSGRDYGGWAALAADETFMGLTYELARGFLLTALYPEKPKGRRVLKFGYSSYVVPADRDRATVRAVHTYRTIRSWSRDRMDSGFWLTRQDPDRAPPCRVVFSTICDLGSEGLREGGPSVTCAEVEIIGPDARRRTLRLRPNDAIALEGLLPGRYDLDIRGRSGFRVDGPALYSIQVVPGRAARVEVRARRHDVTQRDVWAPPLPARPASHYRASARGLAWYSKPLVLRVRLGDGGSYHCEFEAPPGMHVTRARLIADRDTGDDRGRRLDVVLASTQFAHLYAPADAARPSAGYAAFNLRPRRETIARPALTTAIVATLVLLLVALKWDAQSGFDDSLDDAGFNSAGILVVLLGAPSALAAYFAQAVPSRVTNAMLYGLRFAALLPAALVLAAGAVMLFNWPRALLWILALLTGLTIIILYGAQRLAEHPREQRRVDRLQGAGFERTYSVPRRSEGAPSPPPNSATWDAPEQAASYDVAEVRDTMLERAGGMSAPTLRVLLGQPGLRGRWESRIPPALYFDAAETPPTFQGLDPGTAAGRIGSRPSE